MRVFLFCLLFDIIFRSFSVMFPWKDWLDELDMRRTPVRLPTPQEYADLKAKGGDALQKELDKSYASIGEYFNPWPNAASREKLASFRLTAASLKGLRDAGVPDSVLAKLESAKSDGYQLRKPFLDKLEETLGKRDFLEYRDALLDHAEKTKTWGARSKYIFAWLTSRLDIVENMCGINEEWPMFSPNASRGDFFARSRLQYADGTERLIRQLSEPADLTRFTRWNVEKILDHETKVKWTSGREDECWAWCGLLAHRYAKNEHGSPLTTILLYRVYIDYPAPNDPDPRGFLLEQMELTRDHTSPEASPTFYTYDVETHKGTMREQKDE
jgi:hypothetical protein